MAKDSGDNEEALRYVIGAAPGCRTFVDVFRVANEAGNFEWGTERWRSLLRRNPAVKRMVQAEISASAALADGCIEMGSGDVRGIITSDDHAPHHDARAIALAAKVAQWHRPNLWIMAGDQIDFYSLSLHDRGQARMYRLQDEIDTWRRQVYAPIAQAVGDRCRRVKLDGEHEERLRHHLRHHLDMSPRRTFSIDALLDLDSMGVAYTPRRVTFGGLLEVSHGVVLRKRAGSAARRESERRHFRHSTVTGHTHRAGSFSARMGDRWIEARQNPCLCSLKPQHAAGEEADWRQGVTLFSIHQGRLALETVVFDDYTAFAGGQWHEA